jgi:predicted nuclease of restriction endonuclease-like (RecB) superfamily
VEYQTAGRDLEQALITHLQRFLLELGRGFSFVARQKRITFDGRHFRIDLVFYNYYEREPYQALEAGKAAEEK